MVLRPGKFLLAFALSCAASACFAVPRVLIIQPSDTKSDSPFLLSDALAQSIEDEGKLDPIVWSDTDPVFRGAMLDGRVPSTSNPSPQDVQVASKALSCDFVIFLTVKFQGTQVTGHIEMMKGSTNVWKDTEVMDSGRASTLDMENTIRSVARTWAVQISVGPMHSKPAEPKPKEVPAAATGQLPTTTQTQTDPIPTPPDATKAIEEYQRLMSAKQTEAATTVLRQAVDASPLDPKLRVQLIKHLAQIGRSDDAAAEARRASLLLPEDQEIRALAAKAYIQSGNNDQAESQLNEALARNPEDPTTREMLADVALNSQKAQAAKDHIVVALKKSPTKDLHYRRALCDALLGDAAKTQTDIDEAKSATSWAEEETSYAFCMHVLDKALDNSVGDLRSLYQRAGVRREDPDVAQAIEQQLAILSARQTLSDGWSPPESHKNSHGKRSLALKLLAQSLSELRAFLSDGSQDTLTDASIDLGEAVKQLSAARQTLTAEQGSEVGNGSLTIHIDH
jgi:tetratricopeptide (TPR) repeat protein